MTNAVPPVVDFEWESYGLARLNSISILSQRLQPRTSMSAHQWGDTFHGLILNYGFIVGCPDSSFRSLQRCRRKRGVFVRAPHQTCAVQHFSLRVFSSKHRQCFEVGTRPPATPKQRFCLCRPKSSTIFTMNILTRKTQVAHA